MAETKEEFEALEYHLKETWRERDKPRCFNCASQQGGDCVMFDMRIPAEFMYKYTECDNYEKDVPF